MSAYSFKTSCFIYLRQKVKLFHQQLIKRRTKHKHNRLSPSFDFLITSSFATMEASSQFRQIFKVMDSNGDGKISSLELKDVLISLGCDKSKATIEAEAVVKQMDCNGDGVIDLDEFMDAVDDGTNGKEDYLMDAFLIFDADKNGLISATELRRVLINLGCVKCSVEDCRRMINGVDKNGDGFVDFEEFRSMLTHNINSMLA